jgi:hypothetical protein
VDGGPPWAFDDTAAISDDATSKHAFIVFMRGI